MPVASPNIKRFLEIQGRFLDITAAMNIGILVDRAERLLRGPQPEAMEVIQHVGEELKEIVIDGQKHGDRTASIRYALGTFLRDEVMRAEREFGPPLRRRGT